jgi:hypothetical protein
MKTAPLAFAVWFLAACAPMQPTISSALPPNQEMFGLVQSLESNAPHARSDACTANDHACVLAQQNMELATVTVMGHASGNLTAKVLAAKSQLAAGDIVRFRTPSPGQDRAPQILDIGARSAERRPGQCDWEGGSPASNRGGVECKGWSYKQLKLQRAP